MKQRYALAGGLLVAGVLLAPALVGAQDTAPAGVGGLRPVSDFQSIADDKARSVAIFEETGKVLQHPRCLNCHPAGDRPLQGMAMAPHQPPVQRGLGDFGAAGMECNTCHTSANVTLVAQADDLESIPGHEPWRLAPIEMAWVGKSLRDICVQMKDPERNGGKTLADLVEHMGHDGLVGWGWEPGAGREPVPGTQEAFGALYEAWAETGAYCPGD